MRMGIGLGWWKNREVIKPTGGREWRRERSTIVSIKRNRGSRDGSAVWEGRRRSRHVAEAVIGDGRRRNGGVEVVLASQAGDQFGEDALLAD